MDNRVGIYRVEARDQQGEYHAEEERVMADTGIGAILATCERLIDQDRRHTDPTAFWPKLHWRAELVASLPTFS